MDGAEGIVIDDIPSGRNTEVLGKSLAEAAQAWGKEPFDAAFDPPAERRAWR